MNTHTHTQPKSTNSNMSSSEREHSFISHLNLDETHVVLSRHNNTKLVWKLCWQKRKKDLHVKRSLWLQSGVASPQCTSHRVWWTVMRPWSVAKQWFWLLQNVPKHAIRASLKALIGYACGVLFVYRRVTTASLASTHLIFILHMKARDSGISALYFSHRA